LFCHFQQKFNLSAIKIKKKKPVKKGKKPKEKKKKKVVKDVRFSNGKMTDGQALIAKDARVEEMEMDVKVDVSVQSGMSGVFHRHPLEYGLGRFVVSVRGVGGVS
jgi:hypothetical protein